MTENGNLPRVVILGGGFGGLYAAKALADKPVDVTLIDRKNHHTFQPLLYQVALGVLPPGEIASSLRHIVHDAPNIKTMLGVVTGFDLDNRKVKLAGDVEVDYDYLVVALGARHSYFGRDEWERVAPGLKTVEDAVKIRSRLLMAFEKAERRALQSGEKKELHFAVVGGGPTGVELSGAIADLARMGLAQDFRAIDTRKARVTLYEGSPRILGMYSELSSERAVRQLEELGVNVQMNSMVTDVEPGRLKVGEDWVDADVVLWATGVAATPLGRELGAETDRAGRVLIEKDLTLPGRPEVYVIGDMTSLTDTNGVLVPGLGAAAIQQGTLAAKNILRTLRYEPHELFAYRDKGSMATIGYHRAVAEIGKRKLSGYIAWLLWSVVHVFLLIGFRNRVAVMSQWIWAYFTRSVGNILITEHHGEKLMDEDHYVTTDTLAVATPVTGDDENEGNG